MNLWESGPGDSFIKLDSGWVRTSRVEAVTVDDKRWGTTASGKDLFHVRVGLISGATFTHKTTDVEKLMRAIAG